MASRQGQPEDNRAAEAARRSFLLVGSPQESKDPVSIDAFRTELARATLPGLRAKRFLASGANVDGAEVSQSLTNASLGLCLRARISLNDEPFVEMVSTKDNSILARWPVFPVVGGENGPAHVDTESCTVRVSVAQGKLELRFEPLANNEDRGLWQWATGWFRSVFGRGVTSISNHEPLSFEYTIISGDICHDFQVRAPLNWEFC